MSDRLVLRGVCYRHPQSDAAAVESIDFTVRVREVLVVVGPNGSGKSTLLRLCAGLLRPDAGEVELDGEPLASHAPRHLARRIARVPQDLEAWPAVDVRTFVEGGRYAWREGAFASLSADDHRAVTEALQRTDTAAWSERPVQALSGGERQRVLVARALAQSPEILLCDEPTASLDVAGQIQILELCARAACDARAVVLVTHDLNLAAQFADRLVLLHEGRLVADGTPSQVLRPAVLGPVYGDDLHFARLPADDRPAAGRPLVIARRPHPKGGTVRPGPTVHPLLPPTHPPSEDPKGGTVGPGRTVHCLQLDGPPDAEVMIGGERFVYFGGTSYLGLHARREPIDAASRALQRGGLHAATSRSGFGETPELLDCEREAARFLGVEASFHLATGWAAASVWTALLRGSIDLAFHDEHAHFAVKEAIQRLGVPAHVFAHRDPRSLADALGAHAKPATRVLVATDGVFPMSGAIAPLAAYADLLRDRPQAALLVDDAHGLGVLGAHGRGALEHHGLWPPTADTHPRVLLAATLSKALGGFGGLIAGSAADVDSARRASHWFEGASAPAIPIAAAAAAALRIVQDEPGLRDRLRANALRLRTGLHALGLDVDPDTPTPQVSFTRGDAATMSALSERLRAAGLLVPYFASYSDLGPAGALRVAVFATHTDEHIDRLMAAVRAAR